MYTRKKLTLKERVTIDVGAVVELPLNEEIEIPKHDIFPILANQGECYGQFYIRKCLAKQGLIQLVHSPFVEGWMGSPLIVVKNDSVAPIELRKGDEIGELWIMYG